MSFGCYNNTDDIDRLIEMLIKIAKGDYKGKYVPVKRTGEYKPVGYTESFADYFILEKLIAM